MYLIIGLGNPEEEYAKTRHNMGFDTVNQLAIRHDLIWRKKKMDAIYAKGIIEGKTVILLKPQTYMNLSGKAIRQYQNYYNIPVENLIVIQDDIDLPVGTIKIRKKGGAGTHNGMKSVIQELGTNAFSRIRIGIGKPEHKEALISYVIGAVPKEEYAILEKQISRAAQAIEQIMKTNIDKAMNQYN